MSGKILITGASGFVGYHLIKSASLEGFEVVAAIRKSSNTDHLNEFNVTYTDLNYQSVDDLRSQLEAGQFNYIVHAAGITKAKSNAEYNEVNAVYSRNLALAAKSADIPLKKFVFVSSLAALGPLKELTGIISETTTAAPVTSYGSSKLLAEGYLKEISGLPLIIIRPTAVYGPREKDIFILFQSINRGLEPHIGKFRQQLSFIHVTDLVKLILKAAQSDVTGRSYNVSDGQLYDRYLLAFYAKKALKRTTLKFHLPIRLVAALAAVMERIFKNSASAPALNKEKMAELTAVNWACDINHAIQDFGYSPQYNLESGLAETMDWYRANKWL